MQVYSKALINPDFVPYEKHLFDPYALNVRTNICSYGPQARLLRAYSIFNTLYSILCIQYSKLAIRCSKLLIQYSTLCIQCSMFCIQGSIYSVDIQCFIQYSIIKKMFLTFNIQYIYFTLEEASIGTWSWYYFQHLSKLSTSKYGWHTSKQWSG